MPPLSASPIAAESGQMIECVMAPADGRQVERVRLLLMTDTSIEFSGGSERFLRNLVTLLPRERYQITLVQLDAGHQTDADTHLLSGLQHVTLVRLPVEAIYGRGGRRAWRQLSAMVRKNHYHIVQSHHEKSDLFNALLALPSSCIRISNRRDMGFKKSGKLKWLFRQLNSRYDSVIAPAQPILSELSRTEAVDSAKMLWIPNGVDTRKFLPWLENRRKTARHSLSLDDDAIAFGCIARMAPEKRHVDLISAFAQVHAHLPQARLFLVGDGPLHDEIQLQISAAGLTEVVNLMGKRPDIESVLPALDVGLLASCTEGMSNAILEMMSCGLPVIATAVGGNPSLVQHESSGLLIPACQPDQLAQAMISLAHMPQQRRAMGKAGRSRIEREFSLDAMVHSFDQTYQRLLQGKGINACADSP